MCLSILEKMSKRGQTDEASPTWDKDTPPMRRYQLKGMCYTCISTKQTNTHISGRKGHASQNFILLGAQVFLVWKSTASTQTLFKCQKNPVQLPPPHNNSSHNNHRTDHGSGQSACVQRRLKEFSRRLKEFSRGLKRLGETKVPLSIAMQNREY